MHKTRGRSQKHKIVAIISTTIVIGAILLARPSIEVIQLITMFIGAFIPAFFVEQ